MNEFGTAKTAFLNNTTERTGGIAMKAARQFIGLLKKVLGEEIRTDVPYDFYREQETAAIRIESCVYPEKLIVK